jgi:ATP synthase protein I
MTTESKQDTRPGVTVLLGAAMAAAAAVVLLTAVAAITQGAHAAAATGVGGGMALAIYLFGTAALNVVAGIMPTISLLFAMLTYTLQVALMTLLMVAINQSDVFPTSLTRGWLAAGVILTTLTWMGAQIWQATHLRLPAYDLPQGDHQAGAR